MHIGVIQLQLVMSLSLDSGRGLSLKCVQDICNGTCVKLEASKLP